MPRTFEYAIQHNHITSTLRETLLRFSETDGRIKDREKTSDFKQQHRAMLNDDSPVEATVPPSSLLPCLHSSSWEFSLFFVQKQEEVMCTSGIWVETKTRHILKIKGRNSRKRKLAQLYIVTFHLGFQRDHQTHLICWMEFKHILRSQTPTDMQLSKDSYTWYI